MDTPMWKTVAKIKIIIPEHYQQISKEAEDQFGCRPIRLVDCRQEIVDKIFKQRSIVFLAF